MSVRSIINLFSRQVRKTHPEEKATSPGSTIFAVETGRRFRKRTAASARRYSAVAQILRTNTQPRDTAPNLINWGMLPFITEEDHENLSFKNGDYIFVPEIRKAIEDKSAEIKAYVVGDTLKEITLKLGDMTDAERDDYLKRMPDQLL